MKTQTLTLLPTASILAQPVDYPIATRREAAVALANATKLDREMRDSFTAITGNNGPYKTKHTFAESMSEWLGRSDDGSTGTALFGGFSSIMAGAFTAFAEPVSGLCVAIAGVAATTATILGTRRGYKKLVAEIADWRVTKHDLDPLLLRYSSASSVERNQLHVVFREWLAEFGGSKRLTPEATTALESIVNGEAPRDAAADASILELARVCAAIETRHADLPKALKDCPIDERAALANTLEKQFFTDRATLASLTYVERQAIYDVLQQYQREITFVPPSAPESTEGLS